MSRPLLVKPLPIPPAPSALVAVDRALAELRRGAPVCLTGTGQPCLLLAAEAVTPDRLAALTRHGTPELLLTGRRAFALGLDGAAGLAEAPVVRLAEQAPLTLERIQQLSDPLHPSLRRQDSPALTGCVSASVPDAAAAAIALTKLARLLPAAVIIDKDSGPDGVMTVGAADVLAYPLQAARSLRRVAEARVPLADSEQTRIVAFRPADGGIEHLAIIIGTPDRDGPVLARLHSECFTGDLLGSLRCDCGDQLRGAIAEIAATGGGVLLYLAQEGRGIGLVNKLRAYVLQDEGFDTLDANRQLGFDDDERLYAPAAEMLRLLGITAVRLMTNNPAKLDSLARHGVAVCERVPHIFPSNDHNQAYLRTKAEKGGHLF